MKKVIKKIQKTRSKYLTDSGVNAIFYETREMGYLQAREIETTEKQKTVAINYDSLLRWAVDLHHTRRNEQSGFQSVTQLLGFTHPHRNLNYKLNLNKNNLRIASKAVFSSLLSTMLPIEIRYYKYTPIHRNVKKLVDNYI